MTLYTGMERLSPDVLFDSRHLTVDLAKKSAHGGLTTVASQASQFLLRVVGTAILARLLTPTDYGLIGMVTVVVNFAQLLKDAGLSIATVQREHITHEQISTLFWLNTLLSALLGLCVLAGSPLVAWFYGKPELTALTAALSLSFTLTGLGIQHQALLRRHMRFGSLAAIQIAAYALNLVITIVFALAGFRYWALVAGTLTAGLSSTVLTFLICPWVPGRLRRHTGVRGMLKLGGHLTGFNFAHYFSRNSDSLLIGKYLGADPLGFYTKAYQLFMLPIQQIRYPLHQVAMPVLSSLQRQPDRYLKYYLRILDIMATLTTPLTLYCAIEADFLVEVLLGSQWLEAAPVFRILALAALIEPMAGTRGLVLVSYGLSDRFLYWGIGSAVLCVASFLVGLPFGIAGVATAYTIVTYITFVPSLFYCFRDTPVKVAAFLWTVTVPLLQGVTASLCTVFLKWIMVESTCLSRLACACVFFFVYFALAAIRHSVRDTLRLFTSLFPRQRRGSTSPPTVDFSTS